MQMPSVVLVTVSSNAIPHQKNCHFRPEHSGVEKPASLPIPFIQKRFLSRPDRKQGLSILHRLPARCNPLHHFAGNIRLDLIHQLHRLNDAQYLADLNLIADLHKRVRTRRWRLIERPHNRRLHLMQRLLSRSGSSSADSRGSRMCRSGNCTTSRSRSHQPAQLCQINPTSRSSRNCGLPGKLDPHLQIVLLHVELGNLICLQEFDQLAQFLQLISVHHVSSRACCGTVVHLFTARSRPSHSTSEPLHLSPSPTPYLRFAIRTCRAYTPRVRS